MEKIMATTKGLLERTDKGVESLVVGSRETNSRDKTPDGTNVGQGRGQRITRAPLTCSRWLTLAHHTSKPKGASQPDSAKLHWLSRINDSHGVRLGRLAFSAFLLVQGTCCGPGRQSRHFAVCLSCPIQNSRAPDSIAVLHDYIHCPTILDACQQFCQCQCLVYEILLAVESWCSSYFDIIS